MHRDGHGGIRVCVIWRMHRRFGGGRRGKVMATGPGHCA
ncbi:hypothetical protein GLA29479_3540 [Lysobacter antibioticus]|nr:hypothetical protein GLA29479_3540 [Lysobacter antibioticus]